MNTLDIWNQYSEDLKKFILSKVKNIATTEDILQEVFVKIHTKKANLKKETSLKPWLFTIANNTILDEFKKQKKVFIENKTTSTTIEKNNHDATDCILPLILKLPKKYKDVLLLSVIKGKKQAEIAHELKISLPATKSRILRGRELLKLGFIDCCDYTLDENGHLKGEHRNIEDCKVCRPQS